MYDLKEINSRAKSDPKGFCKECEEQYNQKVATAAQMIAGNLKNSHLVLLSGPSSSGKTTTASKISAALNNLGIGTHYISMDDYYQDVGENTPLTEEGEYDLESPYCLDLDLLSEHFAALADGKSVDIPKFDFNVRKRAAEPRKSVRLAENDVCIYEGIHALNRALTEAVPGVFKLSISTASDVACDGRTILLARDFRLIRRIVRDSLSRNTAPAETLSMWANIRRGERLYINPFANDADYSFDTSFPCEPGIVGRKAIGMLKNAARDSGFYDEGVELAADLEQFAEIDSAFVASDSLLREFIGGGVYDY